MADDQDFADDDSIVPETKTPPKRKSDRMAKMRQQKVLDLNNILFNVEAKKRQKILQSCIATSSECLDKFTSSTLNYFRNLLKDARSSLKANMDGAVLLHRIFKDNLYDVDFQMWLVENLNLKDREQLVTFLSLAENTDSISLRGRKQMELDEHVNVYNFWKADSQVSTHRSNNRHLVKISKENTTLNTKDIQDNSIEQIETKRGPKLQAHRKIKMKSFKLLHESYHGLYQSKISYRSFVNMKPFYVSRLTEKETVFVPNVLTLIPCSRLCRISRIYNYLHYCLTIFVRIWYVERKTKQSIINLIVFWGNAT